MLRDEASYGYELATSVSERGFISQRVPPARVYEALQRMEREGAVASASEPSPAGPHRRRYRLTPLGIQRLARWADALRLAERNLSSFLDAYDPTRKEVRNMSCECQCGETQSAVRPPASTEPRVTEHESLEMRLERLEAELKELRSKA
jgi:PadR family transcriptional regulator PadR